MFIGKGSYYNFKTRSYDIFKTRDVRNYFLENSDPFWRWVREITISIFDADSAKEVYPYFAYSNMHKCQAYPEGESSDDYSYVIDENVSTNCITNAGWIYREINNVKPKNVVLFLGFAEYDNTSHYLAKLFLRNENLIKKINHDYYINKPETTRDRKIFLKKRKSEKNGDDYFTHLREGNRRFIVTNHPQNAFNEIRDEIIQIIKDDDWKNSIRWKMPEY